MTITLAVGCWLLAVSFLFEKSNRFPCFFAEQKNIRICLIFCLFFVLSGLSAQTPTPSDTNRAGFLLRTTLYRPGDHNSKNYRIPAIVTAGDGSLVVATDKRKYNDSDLPESRIALSATVAPAPTVNDSDGDDTDSFDTDDSDNSVTYGSGEASGAFMWPLPHTHNITSEMGWRWGRMHNGIDIAGGGDYGMPFVAADGGEVIWAGNDGGGYGNYVMIDHGNGYMTVYGHASELNCYAGQTVSQGDVIGFVGSTGNSTGPHLHFEIRYNGEYQDPLNYVC